MNFRKSDTIVAVIGDHCLDKDYCGEYGKVMSRELEDMSIFDSDNAHYSGGGAANIVDLLQNWGVRVLPCGVWNPLHDPNSRILQERWQKGFVDTQFMVEGYGTPAYVKYYKEDGEHVFRANEPVQCFEPTIQSKINSQLLALSKSLVDIVIVADYNETGHGILTWNILDAIKGFFQCPIIGMSRQRIAVFKDYDYLILNKEELATLTIVTIDSDIFPLYRIFDEFIGSHDGRQFNKKDQHLLVTLEGEGAVLYDRLISECDTDYGDINQILVPSQPQEGVINVCGCGDTFTAAFTICLASGMDEVEAIKRANAAARVQTRKLYGARTVDLDEWEAEYQLLYSEVNNEK